MLNGVSCIYSAYEIRLTANGIPPEPKLKPIRLCSLSLEEILRSPRLVCTTSSSLQVRTPCCSNPVKLFLNFGHSAAPNPYNYVAAFVLYGTRSSVRGLNRWKYEWLALSPKFSVNQHRWRENSYVFQVDQ